MKFTFNKENNNLNEVTLEMLQATRDYISFGKKKGHPIHYAVINQIVEIVKKRLAGSPYSINLSKLWVSPKGGSHLKDVPGIQNDSPGAYLIERVYCRIDLNHATDTDKNMAIGVLFNEHGYNLAFGVNVRECTNFTVYGEHFHSTYGGNGKADHAAIMELLDKWLNEIDTRKDWYYKLVEALKSIQLTGTRVKEIMGDMLQNAVARNNGYRKQESAGLNQTQVAIMALKAYENREKVSVSAWEMLNWGTQLLKPNSSDLADLQRDIADFNNFFIRNYAGLTPEMFTEVVAEIKALDSSEPASQPAE